MASVLALAWHPHRPRCLAAGGANGNVHILKFGHNPVRKVPRTPKTETLLTII